jgi:hypothetical protein
MNQTPPRDIGAALDPESYPVVALRTVGVPAWNLPTTNIIDIYGLNDWVIARNPVAPKEHREMAHDRLPPVGYIGCFSPNLRIVGQNKVVVKQQPLTRESIIACESQDWGPSVESLETIRAYNSVIDSAIDPQMDNYLWEVWPTIPLYLYYVAPDQTPPVSSHVMHDNLRQYQGRGCVVSSAQMGLNTFAFLVDAPEGNMALGDVFPWMAYFEPSDNLSFQLGYVGPNDPSFSPMADSLVATWSNGLKLLAINRPRESYMPGDTIHLSYTYYSTDGFDDDINFFSHLLDRTGPTDVLWGQDDGEPCHDLYPVGWIGPDTTVTFNMAIPIRMDTSPGTYQITTGLYNWKTLERLSPIGGATNTDYIIVDDVEIASP